MIRTASAAAASTLVAFALIAATATANDGLDGECPPEDPADPVARLLRDLEFSEGGVRIDVTGGHGAVDAVEFVGANQKTTTDLREKNASGGARGVVDTVPFTDEEKAAIVALIEQLPPCLIDRANIVRMYRARRDLKTDQAGFLGIHFAYDNGMVNGRQGGQLVFSSLFFDRQAFDKSLDGDKQMQIQLGWSNCHPPRELGAQARADLPGRWSSLPPEVRRMNRFRMMFHEYLHGVAYEQKDAYRTNPASREGFFAQGGPSRYARLRQELFRPGSELETYNEALRKAQTREEYCDAFRKRAEFLKSKGVPARFPGDTHALTDEEEYITILLETAIFDRATFFGPNSAYSKEEQDWAVRWWRFTMDPAGREPGLEFGKCPGGVRSNVAGRPPSGGR